MPTISSKIAELLGFTVPKWLSTVGYILRWDRCTQAPDQSPCHAWFMDILEIKSGQMFKSTSYVNSTSP